MMEELSKHEYHMEEEPKMPLFPRFGVIPLTREMVKDFILEDAGDFLDFCQHHHEGAVSDYLDSYSQELSEWLGCKVRGGCE